ncbi:MAG: FtsX-like permease family protein [Promethearchaeota archaeon]
MSLDFAIKDFYRKKEISFPFLFIVTLAVCLFQFLVYFGNFLSLNELSNFTHQNPFFLTGGIFKVFSNFLLLIIILSMVLSFLIIIVSSITIILMKRKDIGIIKALGASSRQLYHFYLTEIYVILIIGFFIGLIIGTIFYILFIGYFSWIIGINFYFQIDLLFMPILFISCLIGIYLFPGHFLRKMTLQKSIRIFQKDIPYNINASKKESFILKYLSRIGSSFKISIRNVIRKRAEFKRYLFLFSITYLLIFTVILGTFVLHSSSKTWIRKSQGENIFVIGHEDVINNYTKMYEMFHDPFSFVDSNQINFLSTKYLFDGSIFNNLSNNEILKFDNRLVSFFNVTELPGYHYFEDGGYQVIGENRKGVIPIIGINKSTIMQNFEIEGTFFLENNSNLYMVIGDGLAYNLFDSALEESLRIEEINHKFYISGVAVDSFYAGHVGYVDISILRKDLGLNSSTINLLLVKIKPGFTNDIIANLTLFIREKLGIQFKIQDLTPIYLKNEKFVDSLTIIPIFLTSLIGLILLTCLYNYQKCGLLDKIKDFSIMKSIGSKNKKILKILFLELLFISIPSLLISFSLGLIINSLFLFERVSLPDIIIPFSIFGILFNICLLLNYLSILPLLKKIKKYDIRLYENY